MSYIYIKNIQKMKKILLSALLGLMAMTALQAQTVYGTSFDPTDDNTAWIMSSATVNQWHIGHPTAEVADTGWLYISQNGGTDNTYSLTTSTKAWASHDVTLAGGVYTFSFRWKAMGEGIYDYLRCVLVPDTVLLDTTPFATYQEASNFRNVIPDGWINLSLDVSNIYLSNSSTWKTSTVTFSVMQPGNYKIAFLWVNDNSAGNLPPAVVDDVTLTLANTCPPVANMTLNHISLDSAALTWEHVYGAQYLVQIDNQTPVVVDTNRYVIPFIRDVTLSATSRVWTLCASGDTAEVVQRYYYDNNNNSNIGCNAYGLPYFENFDPNLSNSIGFCWWRRRTTQYESLTSPLVFPGRGIGGSAALWFARFLNGNSYGTLYSPYFDAPANELDVSFWIRVIGPNEGVGEVSGANASLTVGIADADIETAADNVVYSQGLITFDYSDLDTAWQFVHFTTDTIDMNYIDGNVRLAFLWLGNTAGIYIDNLQVTRLGVVQDSVPPMVVIGGSSVVQVLDTVRLRPDLVQGTDSAMSYSWHSAMATAGNAVVIASGDTLRIVYTAMGTDTLTLVATNPYGSDTTVRIVTVQGAPQVRIAASPYTVNNGIWLTFTPQYLGGPNVPYTVTWHSNMAAAGQAQIDTTHGDTLFIRYLASGSDVLTLTAGNVFDTCVDTHPVSVVGCVVDTFPFTAIYDYTDAVIDDACWLKVQHVGGGDIYDGWGYSVAGEAGLECMHWEGQPAGEYLLALPPLALPNEGLQLRFKAVGSAVSSGMFSVVVSPTADASAFTDTLPLTPDSISDYYIASLAPYAGQLVLVAFRMAAPEGTGTSVYLLREISVRLSLSPEVTVQGYSKATTCDTMLFTANLIMGDTTDLTYTWTSTKAASGNAVMVADGPRLKIAYSSWGTDVVSVTVSNSYGNYTATCTTQVMTCQEIDSLPRTWVLSVSSTDRYDWQQNRIVSPRGNLSNSYVPSTSWWSPGLWDGIYSLQSNISSDSDVNAWLVSPPIVLDTAVVLRWYAECDNSAYSVRLSPTPYTVGIDGYIDTAYFTETLYTESGASDWSSHEANLSQWQGHTVHIAWVHHGPATDPSAVRAGIRLDTVSIEYATSVDTVWHTVTVNTAMIDGSDDPRIADMVSGGGIYAEGETVTLEAEEIAGELMFAFWVTAESDTLYDRVYTFVIGEDVEITAVFTTAGGIGDVENDVWTLYPNPTQGDVTVSVSQPSTVSVLDMTGREVIPPTPIVSELRLPVSGLPTGVYFVRVGGMVKKLVLR